MRSVAGGDRFPMNVLNPRPSSAPTFALHTLQGESMGTSWSVKLVAMPLANLHTLHAGIQAQLDLVVAQMSTWETDSDISLFNRLPADTWQPLPEAFFNVLSCALEIARKSGGAYDPSIGALVQAWGFGAADVSPHVPDPEMLAAARTRVGWQHIGLQEQAKRARQPGEFLLDLSAIAKGYSVDAIAVHLRKLGITAALVEVGGELYGYGCKPDGSAWQVLVEAAPDKEEQGDNPACVIALNDMAIATSGDHWHVFEHDEARYSHTLDPRTGEPVKHAPAAVTVIADSAMHADAWATALTVMGGEAGFEFAQNHRLAARFVLRRTSGLVERMTDAFEARLTQ